MIADRIQAALGNKPADLVIENGQIVNVYTGEIYPGGVAISGIPLSPWGIWPIP